MGRVKFDGVIEAVHYRNGQIDFVRAYERRGPTFSDIVLLDRKALLERLKNGKRFVTGRRREYLAGTFEVGKPLRVTQWNGRDVITTRATARRDDLEEAPLV